MASSSQTEQDAQNTFFPQAAFLMPLSQVIRSQQSCNMPLSQVIRSQQSCNMPLSQVIRSQQNCNMKPTHHAADGDSQSYQIVPPVPWSSNASHRQLPLTLQSENTSVHSHKSERDVDASAATEMASSHNRIYQHIPTLGKSTTQDNYSKQSSLTKTSFDLQLSQIIGSQMFSDGKRPLSVQKSRNSLFSEAGSQKSRNSLFSEAGSQKSRNSLFSEAGSQKSRNSLFSEAGSQKSRNSLFSETGNQKSRNPLFSEAENQYLQIPPAPDRSLNSPGSVWSFGQSQHSKSHQRTNEQLTSASVEQGTSSQFVDVEPRTISGGPGVGGVQLRIYQDIFSFPYFNILQSLVFDEVFYTDRSIVVSAPTGSGKTVIFELALIRLLTKRDSTDHWGKIVYMAPMKALCSEKYRDWTSKFARHGITCLQITGDSELDDCSDLLQTDLICTTPEKWDSMSRRWKDNRSLFHQIQLFLIDEIHILNDQSRGATVEAVVSRMKTLQTANPQAGGNNMRFVAASATMPNYDDIATWLGTSCKPAAAFNLGEKFRPVKLDRIVLGYPFKEGSSDFRFDMNLSYRLRAIIETYSHGKPTLVFCSSRKSVIQTAEVLVKSAGVRTFLAHSRPEVLQRAANAVHESKLADLMMSGVGIHHAGMDIRDRNVVEDLFRTSQLPVLISTSTLAMGVNLPAHLVVIKSTHFYNLGVVQEYSDMQVLQMIGRAGRPQFDTSATAVIMTKAGGKAKYESLVQGTQLIESSLHKNLIEHLNAEIVLQTISDMSLVVEWIRHTFLYVRVMRNPKYYGLPANLSTSEVEKRLTDLCQESLARLSSVNLVSVNEATSAIFPTSTGRLMARFCIAYQTMRQFHNIEDDQASMADMLTVMSQCSEFEDIQLRTNEKKTLNAFNRDKNRETIRFPMSGKIKTREMKVNCLIQAQLSCLPVQDFSLSQDMAKIFRVGQRIAKCLMEFMYQRSSYPVLLHAILIYKAFKSKLWFDSRYVARQLDGIGPTMSLALANSGLTSFEKLEEANPREIEVIVNRHPPFGNQVKEAVSALPKYELGVEQLKCYKNNKAVLVLSVSLLNRSMLETRPSSHSIHQSLLIVGDADNILIFKCRISDAAILRQGHWNQTLEVKRSPTATQLNISLLSQDWVGLDICVEYQPVYSDGWFQSAKIPHNQKSQTPPSKLSQAVQLAKMSTTLNSPPPAATPPANKSLKNCSHKCLDKSKCGHKCCKINSSNKRTHSTPTAAQTPDAKLARRGQSVVRANRDIKEMFDIVQRRGFLGNVPRISMPRNPGLNVSAGTASTPQTSRSAPRSCFINHRAADEFHIELGDDDDDVFMNDLQIAGHSEIDTGSGREHLQRTAPFGGGMQSLPDTLQEDVAAGRDVGGTVWSTTTSSDEELCQIVETTEAPTADDEGWPAGDEGWSAAAAGGSLVSNVDCLVKFDDVDEPGHGSQHLQKRLLTRSEGTCQFFGQHNSAGNASQSVISVSSTDSQMGGSSPDSRSPFLYAGKLSQPITPTLQANTNSSLIPTGKQNLDVNVLKSGYISSSCHTDKSSYDDGDDRSSSQQSHHRYGLVQAWNKSSVTSCTSDESVHNVTCGAQQSCTRDENVLNPTCGAQQCRTSQETVPNPACGLSMLFVPRQRSAHQDSHVTTNLFEGIF